MREVTFDICPCPALYPYYHQEDSVVVVVDILRAGTSMVAAFDHGAKEIIPVATTEEAFLVRATWWLPSAMRCVARGLT